MEREAGTVETALEAAYEAPTVARVPLEEGTTFTAAGVTTGIASC